MRTLRSGETERPVEGHAVPTWCPPWSSESRCLLIQFLLGLPTAFGVKWTPLQGGPATAILVDGAAGGSNLPQSFRGMNRRSPSPMEPGRVRPNTDGHGSPVAKLETCLSTSKALITTLSVVVGHCMISFPIHSSSFGPCVAEALMPGALVMTLIFLMPWDVKHACVCSLVIYIFPLRKHLFGYVLYTFQLGGFVSFEFFEYFLHQTFIRYTICKYFLPVHVLSSHFLSDAF